LITGSSLLMNRRDTPPAHRSVTGGWAFFPGRHEGGDKEEQNFKLKQKRLYRDLKGFEREGRQNPNQKRPSGLLYARLHVEGKKGSLAERLTFRKAP